MNKLNLIATAVVCYVLSLLIVISVMYMQFNEILLTLVILPVPLSLLFYTYLYNREAKTDYDKSWALLQEELSMREKQVDTQLLIIKELHSKIDKMETVNKDFPFADLVPYIGMSVGVYYGTSYIETHITKILDEKVIKYRCHKCGNRKYLLGELQLLV